MKKKYSRCRAKAIEFDGVSLASPLITVSRRQTRPLSFMVGIGAPNEGKLMHCMGKQKHVAGLPFCGNKEQLI